LDRKHGVLLHQIETWDAIMAEYFVDGKFLFMERACETRVVGLDNKKIRPRNLCGEFVGSAWESCEWNVEEKFLKGVFELVFRKTARNSTAHPCESSAACLRHGDFSTNPQRSSQQQGSFDFIFRKESWNDCG